jgi:DNA-binding transcriptional regulator YdaS (Cro superfamily)
MDLLTYIKTLPPADRQAFARRCGTSPGHLNNVAYGYKKIGAALAIALERETAGRLAVETLRPDLDWHVIRARPAPLSLAA